MDTTELHRLLLNIVRKGVVKDVSHATTPPKCRVSIGDLHSNWLPWITPAAGASREWDPPTFGEQVILLCPGGDPAQGVVLRGLFSEAVFPPSFVPSAHTREYADGAVIEYDHEAHSLSVELPESATVTITAPGAVTVRTKDATVQADNITLDAQQTTCTGALTVKGPFAFESGVTGKGGDSGATMQVDGAADFTGEVKSKGISLPHHSHREQGDGQLVGEPV
ncbi:phage baseplate assembly protein V [Trinickia symbiotica]|uniref:Phage baseplate assembly protein V n=1 Tax=Trinickia symbiotica TaxID=863227 RepID=A0A2T3XSP7_9BURK|nr:phage baseplate assembly protein V [Trinickia symbiotica]PTB19549.1 phage baseplate assembly protein V [Trinickia symbiotica]